MAPMPADTGRSRGSPGAVFRAFARLVIRHRRIVLVLWAVLLVVSVLLAPRFREGLTGPPLGVAGSDSLLAQDIIETRFELPAGEQDLVVFTSETLRAGDPAYQQVVADSLAAVRTLPDVVAIISPYDPSAEGVISEDARVAAAIVAIGGSPSERQAFAPRLTRAAESAATDDVQIYVTGASPLIADLVAQESEDLARAERLGLPLALLILLVASGSLVAAGLPLLLAIAGMAVTFGVLGAATSFSQFNLFVPNIATMIGLGVGIDYALFVVTRFREELAHGREVEDAAAASVATAGKTIFFSGMTVLVSLSGMLLVDARIFRELAAGAMSAVAVMVVGALTLMPAALAMLGHRVERLAIPGWRGFIAASGDGGFWARWAHRVMARPIIFATLAIAVLLLLASPAARIRLSLDTGATGAGPRSATMGREILEAQFNEGRISPLQVVYVSRDGALDDADLDAIARLSTTLANDWAVVEVTSVTTLLDRFLGNHSAQTLALAAGAPQAVAAAAGLINIHEGSDVAVIRAVPRWSPDSPGPLELVDRVRGRLVPDAIGDLPVDVHVGGLSAQIVDITDESYRKLPLVAGMVVGASFLLLAAVFRSLVLPIKAILLNALGIAAAYGVLVVVFQEGRGAHLLGFQPTGSIQVYLPLLTFAVVFGLSMDYEVFLLGRMKEEWERTGDNATAVASGLQHTAGVITSAAAIMVAVFGAFVLARLTEVKALGFSLAVAVLLDATIVRIVLVPAAMQLMGRWNWWFPAWLDRIVPRIDLAEGEAGSPAGDVSVAPVPPPGAGR